MNIRYRDKSGRFISEKSARRRKSSNVRSELVSDRRKSLGTTKGFWTSIKKLQRTLSPRVKIGPAHRPPVFEEDEDTEDFENQWDEDFLDDFLELDMLIDEIDFEDDEEFYEEQ